jgi:hypothetical protein
MKFIWLKCVGVTTDGAPVKSIMVVQIKPVGGLFLATKYGPLKSSHGRRLSDHHRLNLTAWAAGVSCTEPCLAEPHSHFV